VRELLTGVPGMDSTELSEWMAWTGIRGALNPVRSDVVAAMLGQLIIATKSTKRTKLTDFMPFHHLSEKKELSPEALFQAMKAGFRAVPKKIEKK